MHTERQPGFTAFQNVVLYEGFDPSSSGWKPDELATVLIEHVEDFYRIFETIEMVRRYGVEPFLMLYKNTLN